MSSLCFFQRIFDWGEGSNFWMERKVEGLEENYPKYVKKALISKKTLGRLTNWILTDTFE